MVTLLENPLRMGLQQERTPEPQIIVIFGASGILPSASWFQRFKAGRHSPETTMWEWHVGTGAYFHEHAGIEQFSDGIGPEDL